MSEPVCLGRFRTIELLKRGSASSVYRGEDPKTGQQVCITLYRPPASAPEQAPRHERLEREFRRLAREHHPGVIGLCDVGRAKGASYTATLLCTDPTLDHLLGQGALPSSEALRILDSMARTLDDLHRRGIVHRNLAASSVFVSTEGAVRLSDFLRLEPASAALLDSEPQLEGVLHVAPEQVLGYRLRPAANRYSFAVLAYRMLSGDYPFAAENPIGFLYDTVYTEAPAASARNPDLPAAIDPILATALSKDPEKRPIQCEELVRQLACTLSTAPIRETSPRAEPTSDAVPQAQWPVLTPSLFSSRELALTDRTATAAEAASNNRAPEPIREASPRAEPTSDAAEQAQWPVLTPSLFSSRELALTDRATTAAETASNDHVPGPRPEERNAPSNARSPSARRQARAELAPVVLPDPEQIDEHRGNQGDGRQSSLSRLLTKLRQLAAHPRARHASGSIVHEAYLTDWRAGVGRDRADTALFDDTSMAPSWRLKIESDRPGAIIWVNGRFYGKVPTDIEISGRAGESVALEMRWRGGGVARTDLKLHPLMPKVWKPDV